LAFASCHLGEEKALAFGCFLQPARKVKGSSISDCTGKEGFLLSERTLLNNRKRKGPMKSIRGGRDELLFLAKVFVQNKKKGALTVMGEGEGTRERSRYLSSGTTKVFILPTTKKGGLLYSKSQGGRNDGKRREQTIPIRGHRKERGIELSAIGRRKDTTGRHPRSMVKRKKRRQGPTAQ